MIRQRGGSLEVVVYQGGGRSSPRKVSRTIKGTDKEAWRRARQIELDLQREAAEGRAPEGGPGATFGTLIDRWLEHARIQPSTLYVARGQLEGAYTSTGRLAGLRRRDKRASIGRTRDVRRNPVTITAPWQEADLEPDLDAEPPSLALTDRAGADRHLAAIARIEREYELEKAGALAEVERIQRWIAQRYESTTAQTGWHREVLHRYHEAVLAVDPRLKTIKLPHGELQARAQQPSWEIDAPTALAWLVDNLPSVVRPPKPSEPSIDVAALKRSVVIFIDDEGFAAGVVSPDGEVVPGVTVTEREPKFSTVIAEPETEVHDDSREREDEAYAQHRDDCAADGSARDYDAFADGEPF